MQADGYAYEAEDTIFFLSGKMCGSIENVVAQELIDPIKGYSGKGNFMVRKRFFLDCKVSCVYYDK